ncbi:MAG: hypothetical protein SCARUB_01725 [Candidatus Scalindua rubra]|uniref:Uncharacterized protein n=1 Tax=Candidatus Scalindua rubra TaxID=1872076 RepID=A0A1E3XC36_9BACT|nr:MAG: hypothetical protein SCARUB_01725 [Candidatus Scalindua rubra]
MTEAEIFLWSKLKGKPISMQITNPPKSPFTKGGEGGFCWLNIIL